MMIAMYRYRRVRRLAIIAAIIALSALDHAGVFGFEGDDRTRYADAVATVTYAAAGDTLDIDIPDGDRAVTRVRLRGVDCPEVAHGPDETDAHFGPQATAFVRELVVGRRVRVLLNPNRRPRDRFGRLLAYLHFADTGESINELLVNRGLAYADRRFAHVLKHRFVEFDKVAMKAGTGLWAEGTPEQMPGWRQRMDAAGAW